MVVEEDQTTQNYVQNSFFFCTKYRDEKALLLAITFIPTLDIPVLIEAQTKKPDPTMSIPLIAHFPDDPYYCGLRARIPNFAKSKSQKEKEANALYARLPAHAQAAIAHAAAAQHAAAHGGGPSGGAHHPGGPAGHPMAWHGPARGYLDNGEKAFEVLKIYSTNF